MNVLIYIHRLWRMLPGGKQGEWGGREGDIDRKRINTDKPLKKKRWENTRDKQRRRIEVDKQHGKVSDKSPLGQNIPKHLFLCL